MLLEVIKCGLSLSFHQSFYFSYFIIIIFFSDMALGEVEDAGSSQGLLKVQGKAVTESSFVCSSCQRNRLVGYFP